MGGGRAVRTAGPERACPLRGGGAGRRGPTSLPFAIAVGVGASLLSDSIWYEIGRARGSQVTRLLCRISLEPDSCVRRSQNMFARYGGWALLVAKFVPGSAPWRPRSPAFRRVVVTLPLARRNRCLGLDLDLHGAGLSLSDRSNARGARAMSGPWLFGLLSHALAFVRASSCAGASLVGCVARIIPPN